MYTWSNKNWNKRILKWKCKISSNINACKYLHDPLTQFDGNVTLGSNNQDSDSEIIDAIMPSYCNKTNIVDSSSPTQVSIDCDVTQTTSLPVITLYNMRSIWAKQNNLVEDSQWAKMVIFGTFTKCAIQIFINLFCKKSVKIIQISNYEINWCNFYLFK